MNRLCVSVVIPCHNESLSIAKCVDEATASLQTLDVDFEIVVVDNQSNDGSGRMAKDRGAKVVVCDTLGYGAAVHQGVLTSRGDIIVIGDGDGSYDFSKLHDFVLPFLSGGQGIVVGFRFNKLSPEPGAMPWLHRYIGNPFLTLAFNVLFLARIRDVHCGLRSFTRNVYDEILPRSLGFEYCTEMLIRAVKNNISIHQVPIQLRPTHPLRRSKLHPIRDGLRNVGVMLLFIFGVGPATRVMGIFR